ncbi:MAG TPA: CHRD domain-containing protein [Nitrospirota bacterium]|nr:CHRD domain-containing protein [Nitrospirota bacterium]
MKRVKLLSFLAVTVFLTASLGIAANPEFGHRNEMSHLGVFKAKLTGKEEIPATETKATGEAAFKLSEDGAKIFYNLKLQDIENVNAAHIHIGKRGGEGSVVVGLFAGPTKEGKFSGVLARGAITELKLVGPLAGKTISDLVALLKSGEAYVNVHTDRYPTGEIRGQIK